MCGWDRGWEGCVLPSYLSSRLRSVNLHKHTPDQVTSRLDSRWRPPRSCLCFSRASSSWCSETPSWMYNIASSRVFSSNIIYALARVFEMLLNEVNISCCTSACTPCIFFLTHFSWVSKQQVLAYIIIICPRVHSSQEINMKINSVACQLEKEKSAARALELKQKLFYRKHRGICCVCVCLWREQWASLAKFLLRSL